VLDSDAEALRDLLAEAIGTAEQEQARLHMDAEVDNRVLDALGKGGLLPPGDEITAALAVLTDKNITAWSGWQYLASVLADERDQVLARYPYLVDGIVLNSGDDLVRAREELTAARLLPRTVIAVGTTAAIAERGAGEPAGIGFIVPPSPAMYDAEQAEQEQHEIQRRQETRRAQVTRLSTVIAADRELSSRLAVWRQDYPSGRLGALSGDYDRAVADLRVAQELEREQRGLHKGLAAAEKELRQQLAALNAHAKEIKERAAKLAALAAEYAKIPGWQDTIRSARGDVTRAEEDARRAHSRAKEFRRQQSEAHREADDRRRIAVDCRQQLGAVTGGGSVDEAVPVPEEPLESLRAAYQAAEAAYQKVEVGADLRAELSRVDKAEAAARAVVEGISGEMREQASALLNTPDGTGAAARAAAAARARRLAEALEGQVTDAAGQEGKLKQQYESFQPQERSLEPYGRPHDIPHGEELISAATVERDEARKNLDEMQARKEALHGQIAATEVTITEFGAVRESLAGIVTIEVVSEVEPFAGTVESARLRRGKVRETLTEAVRLLEDATQQVRRAADALAQHATDERFEKVAAPVRRQMITTDRERLPDFAEEWEAALRPRFRVLSDELEQLERHRVAITTRLQGMVTYALGRLRAAQKASRLPDGLGDWSGLEFLRIGFTQPEEAVLTERLGQVIDDATVASTGTERASGKRDGLSLMLTGVRAALRPRGVRVDMLKPDAVLRDERVRVAEIGDVFSGGQLLTAAIILYCTMASLRASERGQARRGHAGVLFLDNPIGRASAGYLLELQLAVADKLRVQLVYTTGLFDTNALSVFPLIIRLRNDADLRAGMKYLNVDEEIRVRLPDQPSDGSGVLTASRLFARPADRVP
jgi:DNA repair exonuclease SbcCD ATPase subunit